VQIAYIQRRFLLFLITIFLGVTINFVIPRLVPGDPIEQKLNQLMASGSGQMTDISAMVQSYRERFGLDQPLFVQYINYWRNLFNFDLGYSLDRFPERVSDTIAAALPWTLGLVGVSTLISFVLGTMMGGLIAWPRVPQALRTLIPLLMIFSAIPYYILGLVLIFVFAILLKALPAGGGYPFNLVLGFDWESIKAVLTHALLPAASMIITGVGSWALSMRGMIISILGEDFITLADAKGLKQPRIFFWYALRNGMLPQITTLGLALSHVVAGAILVEVIFAYPGIGFKLFQAIGASDYFVIQGIVLMIIIAIASILFIMDLIYPLIDPRITYGRR
jgi:peptide/nickel transport system permease protein